MTTQFLSAEPFPHLVIDGAIPCRTAAAAADEFDALPSDAWVRYSGHDEAGKRACNDVASIERHAPTCAEILRYLTSPAAAGMVSALTALDQLQPDSTLYGGGLHLMEPGSSLGLHLDNELHPRTGLLRRVNLILYVQPGDAGGALCLWDRSRKNPKRIAPEFRRAVLMRTDGDSYHSVETVWGKYQTPDKSRKSIAVYYWSPPRARARFLSTADEPLDAAREAARLARSTRHAVEP